MTDEQNERLRQIRERRNAITQGQWRWWHSTFNDLSGYLVSGEKSEGIASIVGHVDQDCAADAAFIARAPEDIDFLLSLVDSQIKPDCFPDMIAVNKEYAATLMRSACIEKVKEIRRSYHGSADEAVKAHDYSSEHTLLHKATAAREIIAALESVTIQEQKHGQTTM